MGNIGSSSAPSGSDESTLVGKVISLRHGTFCTVERELARGGFSIVCACTRDSDGKKLALKRVKTQGREAENEAMGEVRAHAILGNDAPCSEYIVPLLETHVERTGPTDREISLFFPLFSYGSLSDLLLKEGERIPEKRRLELFLSCAKAVCAIHERGVAHCDIKPMNYMIADDENHCILIDFGSARGPPLTKKIENKAEALKEQERAERFCSAAFRSPELWDVPHRGYELDFSKSDVFALGCVLYALCFHPYGYSPFESPTQGILALAARTASVQFPQQVADPVRGARDLALSMLAADPNGRPTAKVVVEKVDGLLKEISEEDFDVDFAST